MSGRKNRKWEASHQGLMFKTTLVCKFLPLLSLRLRRHQQFPSVWFQQLASLLRLGENWSGFNGAFGTVSIFFFQFYFSLNSDFPTFPFLGVNRADTCALLPVREVGFFRRMGPSRRWVCGVGSCCRGGSWWRDGLLFSSSHVWHCFAIFSPCIAPPSSPSVPLIPVNPATCAGITLGSTSAKTNAPWPPPTVRRLLG